MQKTEITVLVENTSACGLRCEHGLSLYIKYNGSAYLLDAGSSGLFLENAAALSVDLSEVRLCVLSHGHYDHANGFEPFLEKYPDIPVYAMRSYGGDHYSGAGGMHYIGVPDSLKTRFRDRFHLIDTVTEIEPGVWLVPHTTPGLDQVGKRMRLFTKTGVSYTPDCFAHEMSLAFVTEKGLVICSSCSHAGLLAILTEVSEAFPGQPLYAFFGGLHMKGSRNGEVTSLYSEEELQALVRAITPFGLQQIYTGHCTGAVAYAMLEDLLGNALKPMQTGMRIEVG